MKKIFSAVICMSMIAMSVMAQNHNGNHPQAPHHDKPHHEQVDRVVNMEIVREMGLPAKKVAQIEALQQRKQQEMKAHKQHRHGQQVAQGNKPHHSGQPVTGKKSQQIDHKKMQAHKQQMQAFRDNYRKELHAIMGDKAYTRYLEKVNDRMVARHHRKGVHRHNNGKHQQASAQHQHHEPVKMPRRQGA